MENPDHHLHPLVFRSSRAGEAVLKPNSWLHSPTLESFRMVRIRVCWDCIAVSSDIFSGGASGRDIVFSPQAASFGQVFTSSYAAADA